MGKSQSTTSKPARSTYAITEEERQRRAEVARRLASQVDPETGRRRFGGPQPGSGRPRKKRAAEIVAEEATKNAQAIIQAFKDSLDPAQPAAVRLSAAKQWLQVERDEATLQLQEEREDRELEKLSQDELVARAAEMFARLQTVRQGVPLTSSERAAIDLEGTAVELEPRAIGDG